MYVTCRICHWQSRWWDLFLYWKSMVLSSSSQKKDTGLWKGLTLLQREIWWRRWIFSCGWLRITHLILLWRLKDQIIWSWYLSRSSLPINSDILPNKFLYSTFDLYQCGKVAHVITNLLKLFFLLKYYLITRVVKFIILKLEYNLILCYFLCII